MPFKRIVLALPLALGWTIYTAQPTPGNFLLGYIFSIVVLIATGLHGQSFNLRSAPRQLYNLFVYVVYMAFEVLGAGVKGRANNSVTESADRARHNPDQHAR